MPPRPSGFNVLICTGRRVNWGFRSPVFRSKVNMMAANLFVSLAFTLAVVQQAPSAPAPDAPPAAAAAQSEASDASTVNTSAPDSYVIGPQDQLRVTVFNENELTNSYRVDDGGFITFPLLSRVAAGGKTIAAFQDFLRTQLAEFIRNPEVRVDIDQFKSQSVMVVGEVRQPGKIAMTGPSMTLLEALVQAGSPTAQASNEVIVQHKAVSAADAAPEPVRVNRKDLELGKMDIALRDGDLINVPTAQRFYMDGMVRNPGYYILDPGMTVQQAIALAGGLNERGSDRGIKAKRLVNGKSVEVNVDLEDKVQANDTLTIRSRFF
jgi:polysaccharide biosynthesis/export protein